MADPVKIAEMITQRATEFLAPMEAEMNRKGWPQDLRAIMWQAVADMAGRMAADSKAGATP